MSLKRKGPYPDERQFSLLALNAYKGRCIPINTRRSPLQSVDPKLRSLHRPPLIFSLRLGAFSERLTKPAETMRDRDFFISTRYPPW